MRNLCPVAALLFGVWGCGLAMAQTTTESLKATFDSGVAAYDAGDFPKAFKIWSSIDDDDVAAMRNVGIMLRKGLGVPKDPKAAEEMFEQAAEAGLPTAQADLADMLLKGEAGPPNPERALPLLQAAAAANHPIAQYELAQMYETGQLVTKDLSVARGLYAAAAKHGMPEAQARLDALGPAPTAAPATPPTGPAPPPVSASSPAPASNPATPAGDSPAP